MSETFRLLLERVEPWLPDKGETPAEDRELARLRADVREALHPEVFNPAV